MNPEMLSSKDLEALELKEELLDFTNDLLALKVHEPSLHRLFSHPVGQWSDLSNFLERDDAVQQLLSLQSASDGTLRVTWLEQPGLDQGYCLVLFYLDSLGWNNLALYNRVQLETSKEVAAT